MSTLDYLAYEGLDLHDIESDTTGSCYQFPCKHSREEDHESLFPPGSEEYKKARKRRQNRESAVRIRARKKLEECHIFTSLDGLKANTGKLKIENAHLKSENDALRKQIEMFKKLAQSKKPEEPKIIKEETQQNQNIEQHVGKGKRIAGFGLTIAILSIISIFHIDDAQPVNTGSRSLSFNEDGLGMKPVLLTVLVLVCACLTHFLIMR